MKKWVSQGVVGLFFAMLALVLGLVVCCFEGMQFACKRTFLLPQWGMLALGIGMLAAVMILVDRVGTIRWLRRFERTAYWGFWLLLFLLQAVGSYFSYFLTGWDAGMMLEYAHWVGVFGYQTVNDVYYSMHPNNVLITMVFAWIMRLFTWIVGGEPGLDRCALVVILVQCLINTATGVLCQDTIRRVSRSKKLAWVAALVYAVFVGLSPWTMIPYTDSMTLFVPMLILWLYVRMRRSRLLAWAGIGLLTGLGYLLKPQAVIVTIALVIVETVWLMDEKRYLQLLGRLGVLVLCAVCVIGPCFDAVVAASGFKLDPEKNIGALHFMMMGLNEHTNGGFYAEDENITIAAPNRAQRRQDQLEEIGRRIERYGFFGMAEHLKKKTMTNYADGTFAWGVEGQFFDRLIEDKDSVISPALKRLIYPNEAGKMPEFTTLYQCIWLGLLLGALLSAAQWRWQSGQDDRVLLAMLLSIIGLTVFEWIFEARARYLYIYAPFYVMLGVWGLWHMLKRWMRNT